MDFFLEETEYRFHLEVQDIRITWRGRWADAWRSGRRRTFRCRDKRFGRPADL